MLQQLVPEILYMHSPLEVERKQDLVVEEVVEEAEVVEGMVSAKFAQSSSVAETIYRPRTLWNEDIQGHAISEKVFGLGREHLT